MLKEEDDASALLSRLLAHNGPRRMSAGSLLELHTAVARYGYATREFVEQLVDRLGIEVVTFDAALARVGIEAYRHYGRGTGHSARLNFGDCFAYALAKATGEPLLFKGDDFSRTDVIAA